MKQKKVVNKKTDAGKTSSKILIESEKNTLWYHCNNIGFWYSASYTRNDGSKMYLPIEKEFIDLIIKNKDSF